MTDMNSFHYTDNVHDVLAIYVNRLMDSTLRSEYKNIETLTADRELTDADAPIQRFECGAADRVVTAPVEDAVTNHPFLLVNTSAVARTLTFKDNAGAVTLAVLLQGEKCLALPDGDGGYVVMIEDAPADGTIYARKDHAWEAVVSGGGGKYPAFVRCSVVSGDPNPADAAAQTAVYVFPWNGDSYPQWNGTIFAAQDFTAQTLSLNAAHTANSLYDIYLWLDGATQRVVTGPAWTSATNRGTGAGTAETEVVNGVMVNKVEMTVRNGANTYTMPARYGTLVGTMCMSANGQINWTVADRGLWNKYNQMPAGVFICPGYVDDNAASSYLTTSTSWTEANGGTGSRVKWVQGEPQLINLVLTALTTIGTSSSSLYGIGLDSITQANVSGTSNNAVAATGAISCNNKGAPIGIGSHYASMLIARGGANNATFYADAARRGGEAVDSPETYITGNVMM